MVLIRWQWVKVLASKLNLPSSNPNTHMEEGEKPLFKDALSFSHACSSWKCFILILESNNHDVKRVNEGQILLDIWCTCIVLYNSLQYTVIIMYPY